MNNQFCIPMISRHFTTKNLLAIIIPMVIVFAGLAFLSRLFAPDPNSESFTILNAPSTPAWEPCARKKLVSTVTAISRPIQPIDGYRGTAESVIRQSLFSYKYTDYFGNETYHIDYSLFLFTNEDWTDFVLHPVVSGGGNVGASAEIETQFDFESRTLSVTVHQQFANWQAAKCVNLEFRWDGNSFTQSNDTEPIVAHVAVAR